MTNDGPTAAEMDKLADRINKSSDVAIHIEPKGLNIFKPPQTRLQHMQEKYDDCLSRLSDVVSQRSELRDLLSQAYAHITLLGSGQTPPNSNAEMCNLLGEALDRLDGRTK